MVSEPSNHTYSDSIAVRFNGKNYALWEYSLRIFIKGKGLLGYLDGSIPEPTIKKPALTVAAWGMNDAKAISYLIGSIEPSIVLSLRSFPTAASIWNHLRKTYSHVNASRFFDLEYSLANLTQGELSINDYYLAATQLWTEIDLISTVVISNETTSGILHERKRSRCLQFLMRLRPEYEQVRSRLIADGTMDIETVLAELIRAETRFQTQAILDQALPSTNGSAFATGRQRPQFFSKGNSMNPSSHVSGSTNPQSGGMKCHFCGELGHPQTLCRKRNICSYCKKPGHIIVDCRAKGRRNFGNNQGATSYATTPMFTSSNSVGVTGSDSASAISSGSSVDFSQLIKAEFAQALPQALNSAFATLGITGTSLSRPWFLDSAAYNHMSGDASIFRSYTPIHDHSVEVANGERLPVAGIGTISTGAINLPSTLHVPQLVPNLISVGQLTESGCDILFGSNGCLIQDRMTKRTLGLGSKRGRNYHLASLELRRQIDGRKQIDASSSDSLSNSHCSSYLVKLSSEQLWHLWHSRLGHPNSSRLLGMFRKQLLPVNDFVAKQFQIPSCLPCIEAKIVALPFYSSTTEIHDAFALIHTDVWGPSPITSRLGYRYFVLFIDHKTRYTWVYFLRLKSELILVLKEFVTMIRTQFDKPIKMFRSDPGGEFTSHDLHQFFKDNGILFQQSCPGVSEQNGLVERKHRHVLDLTRALLLESRVPSHFWVETVRTVVHLINIQPTPILSDASPFEQLYGKLPDYTRLRIFGCTCFVLLPKKDRHKLTAKTARCVFIGYTPHHKGYLCYDPIARRIHTAYHVIFLEHNLYYHSAPTSTSHTTTPPHIPYFPDEPTSTGHLEPITSHSSSMQPTTSPSTPIHTPMHTFPSSPHIPTPIHTSNSSPSPAHHDTTPLHILPSSPLISPSPAISSEPTMTIPPPRRSIQSTRGQPPPKFTDYTTYSTMAVPIPTTYKQASTDPNWARAMQEELSALRDNETWTIVPRPSSAPVIGSKWVFTAKYHPDGSLERYKARLVAQGFRQEYGIDYDETFTPVAKMQTVRVLLALLLRNLGRCTNSMLKMLFSTVNSRRWCIWSVPRALLSLTLPLFVCFIALSMVSNRLLVRGLRHFRLLFFDLAFFKVRTICPCSPSPHLGA
ncbi:Retrovirus-related Pol polyprotein from transposon TNT 1-94 [Linum perenne]